jgi:serine/threonine protein phosphatase PrpC
VIGDPGRAGLELPAGPPGPRTGLADFELSAASLPGMLIRAATLRGLQHRSLGEPRQDAFALGRHQATDAAVAVVCDGVGSLGRSDEAASLVSRQLVDRCAAGTAWKDAFAQVNEELRAYAATPRPDNTGEASHDGMATTAVALAVRWTADEWVGEVAWVGDSALWHLSTKGTWTSLTASDGGADDDFHSTSVRPMPTRDGACTSRQIRVGGGALFLMTDGIANPLDWCEDVRETLAKWWREPPDPFTFASQAAFSRRTHIDDRTVVAIWPDAGGELP